MAIIDFNKVLGSHQTALKLYGKRSAVIAANVANVSTDGYKSRDFDFKMAMNQVKEGLQTMKTTHTGHIRALDKDDELDLPLLYRDTRVGKNDNSVDIQVEQTEFAENAMRYSATLRFLKGRFSGMMNAIREGK